MQTTWILAADNSRARIFEEIDAQHHLQEIQDFAHPAGHFAEHDFDADAKGRYFGKGERSQGHTAEPNVDPITHENERFCRELSQFLEQARNEHRYDRLYVVAPPKFLGLLRKNLSKEAEKLVVEEIVKDLSKLEQREIEDFLRNAKH